MQIRGMRTLSKEITRLKWLDISKGIGMIFIILSHTSGGRNCWIANAYLPFYLAIFFFSSGYLFKENLSFKDECVYVLRHLVIPWILFGIINAVLSYAIEHESLIPRMTGLVLQTSSQYSDMWFLACMASTHILFWVLAKIIGGGIYRQYFWSQLLLMP